ncbi:MAG: flagellar biosynthesis protein FlhA [Planctomycetota bacterium]|nr:flagellar biosynthesis protein FlhA [Planctomycetota bacterium]
MSKSAELPAIFHQVARHRHLIVPIGFLALIGVLVVPLPPFALDVLISGNIALAAIVLLTTIYMNRPLDFSVFPALLLATTLFRLVLNVASTRLILGAENSGDASAAAGKVIEAFANFVAGSNPVIGAIIFLILVIVQFLVITKGATRMSEVAARFTLDAMPGKQMAIDADLSAGLLTEDEARARRDEITREADFYGAMDGASKFVRGDAIAGIIITAVNILGGFAIAMLMYDYTAGEALKVFGMLSIGDGLVSQIPAFIVAIAAGLIVSRAGGGANIGMEIPAQLASQPMALFLISGFLGLLSLTPLPTMPLLLAAILILGIGLSMRRIARAEEGRREAEARQEAEAERAEPAAPEQYLGVDVLELELGYSLVRLVDGANGGDLLDRIARVRQDLAVELGMVMPPVRIRDNMNIPPEHYRVKIRGAVVDEGEVQPELMMAMDSGLASGQLEGIRRKEPAFGLDAIWIDPGLRHRAESLNYTVVAPTSVMATHLAELVRRHADELLTREEVGNLVEQLKTSAPKLVEEVVPALVKPGELQKVMQSLLREGVPIRDLETILETLGDWIGHTRDTDVLVEYVRNALRRSICTMHAELDESGRPRIHVVTMDPDVEDRINAHIDRGAGGTTVSVPPRLAGDIARAVADAARPLAEAGRATIVVSSPTVRAPLRQILQPHLAGVVVLGYNELVDGFDVQSVGLVQLPSAPAAAAPERSATPVPAG